MIKNIFHLAFLLGGILFAQKNDWAANNIVGHPKNIEESNTKAIIRANLIEDYIQEYHTKVEYNLDGYITKKNHFNASGDPSFTEIYTYDSNQRLLKIESTTEDENFVIIKDYEYTDQGYKITESENDIVVKETLYTTDQQGNILAEKETSFLQENLVTTRVNEYQNNKLTTTKVTYGKDGYIIHYKYDANGLPIEEVIMDLKNKLVSKKRRKFDDKKNLVEEFLYDTTGRLKTNSRILYQYDDKGNWIKRTQFANNLEEPISNATRTIRY